ncbi:TAP-like protein-domain-containing protein, partial [Thermothelomyces heterothallicus CBS 202.75]|uniref:TAP-like protein-domain-containing protein n=1 Tax=Thermothelomyces heterothallicus CBS 202.75 TaxID=1149848 RepID=UPI003743F2B8
ASRPAIDGVANQFDWYESRLDAEMIADTDRVLEGFVDECVRAGEERCALAAMATSKEELLDLLLERVARLRDEPVGVYVNETRWGVLDYWTLWYNGVFPALYKPAAWGELADRLAALFRGNATAAWLAYGTKPAWESLGDAFKFISINDGVSGPDKWPTDRLGLLDYLLPFFNQSLFGEAQLDYYFSKQAWTIPHAHSYVPRRRVGTAHPLLILSTTYDPVCPLVSAKGAADVFERSRLVEVKGYGHCTLAVPSRCVARHVRDFLYDGKLPDDGHVRCGPDANPAFAKPEEADALSEAQSLSEEDRRVWKAQQELARDAWLGPWRRGW